jgi:hypothetical protein
MQKLFSYSISTNSNGEIILIKSDHPKYTYEVYWKQTGIFSGYMGNRKSEENKERKIMNQQ